MRHTHLPLFVANWKMALTYKESETFVREGGAKFEALSKRVKTVLCPSFPSIVPVRDLLGQSEVKVAAQDLSWEISGAYTGEVSGTQLKELGCSYVIIGHSERRSHLNESDEMVRSKFHAALSSELIPILCVGETRDQRLAGQTEMVVRRQVRSAFEGFALDKPVVIAYEPVWMIGSGQPVDPSDAQHVIDGIRADLEKEHTADNVNLYLRFLYGGSVSADNVAPFIESPDIHGVLVGGASHKVESAAALAQAIADVAPKNT